jgi:hypothetical protein
MLLFPLFCASSWRACCSSICTRCVATERSVDSLSFGSNGSGDFARRF